MRWGSFYFFYFFKYERVLMPRKKKVGKGQAFIPFLKLHLYFTEVTEDRLLYFRFFSLKYRVYHDDFMCVGIF